MTREQVNDYLSRYRESKARTGHLEQLIPEKEAEIERRLASLLNDAAIETPAREEGMPHGSGVSNPVESIVLRYADGFVPDDIRQEMDTVAGLKKELTEKLAVIRFVDAWLSGLNEREQWIVRHKVIDTEFSWRECIIMFRLQYGEEYSRDGLKLMKDRAMEKIYSYAA